MRVRLKSTALALLGLVAPQIMGLWDRAMAINSQAGTSGAQFLKIGAGSRAGAMADAYSALGDDAYSLYYNPAAMTLLREPQLGAAHTSYFQDSKYEVANFVYPLRGGREEKFSRHVLGIGIYNLSVADIERRTADTNTPIGTFGASDYAYALGYGYRWDPSLGIGAAGKVIHQAIDSYSSTAFALDVGAHYTPRPEFERPVSFAAVIRNAGTASNRPAYAGGVADPLPLGFVLGAGYEISPKALRVEVDATKYRDTNLFLAAGAEYKRPFGEGIAASLRGGYSTHRKDNAGLNEITLGMGFSYYRASFDFAWIPFGNLGDTFRYSLLIRFGGAPANP